MLWSVTTGAKRRQMLSGAGAIASLKRRSTVSSKVEAQMLAEKLRPATAAASATAVSRLPAKAVPAPVQAGVGAVPVVTVAPNEALLEKLKSNMQEVRARGGVLYVLADADTRIASGEGLHVLRMPEHYGPLSPLLHVVPLQLLAYHTAVARGTDVDKPRNLAKSVTVE